MLGVSGFPWYEKHTWLWKEEIANHTVGLLTPFLKLYCWPLTQYCKAYWTRLATWPALWARRVRQSIIPCQIFVKCQWQIHTSIPYYGSGMIDWCCWLKLIRRRCVKRWRLIRQYIIFIWFLQIILFSSPLEKTDEKKDKSIGKLYCICHDKSRPCLSCINWRTGVILVIPCFMSRIFYMRHFRLRTSRFSSSTNQALSL